MFVSCITDKINCGDGSFLLGNEAECDLKPDCVNGRDEECSKMPIFAV